MPHSSKICAENFGLPFHYKEVQVSAEAGNLEQAGRNARLAFFDSLTADRIATGHTSSDQAETVLYRLLSGAGTAGLAGILPVAGRRIRPLDRLHPRRGSRISGFVSYSMAGRCDQRGYLVRPQSTYVIRSCRSCPKASRRFLPEQPNSRGMKRTIGRAEIDRLAGNYLQVKG